VGFLRGEDYLSSTARSARYDAVTCWGLLEYTPEPARIVAAAREQLDDGSGMLIIEVPRADALSSAVQVQFPGAVWRHLAPSSHVNIFSDSFDSQPVVR
jgi:2-polyprenyl-3-methyl-5-hydroxy-6-metoxy-1,4-benzoquinol methylase